jgi:hypothetical protein
MATDTYAILWLGIEHLLGEEGELDQVTRGQHRLIRIAKRAGLDHYCDRFFFNEQDQPVYSLLIGKCLAMLGHKEGVTRLRVPPDDLRRQLDRVKVRFERAGLRRSVRLILNFHVEFDE